jgi:predicted nuclease with TOPRIM domain
MANAINNTDDTIDSRDVIERIEELQTEIDDLDSEYSDANDALEAAEENPAQLEESGQTIEELRAAVADARENVDDWNNSEEGEELRALLALQEEAEGYAPDWRYGSQLIRDSYFEEAMDEMVEECYPVPDMPWWMSISIDYSALQQDYTAVDFDGVTYWVR